MRLIDADALEDEIVKTKNYVLKDAVLDIACMVNRAPTIEAKPVVHAHWEWAEGYENELDKVKITLDKGAKMLTRAHKADAGFDLYAMQDIYVMPQGRVTADTGVHIEIPEGYFGDIRPKSGLLFNHNLFTAGTVDSGYRGAVKVRIINFGNEPYQFRKGEKIAQMVLVPCLTPALEEVEELDDTERGNGGFGSTGK